MFALPFAVAAALAYGVSDFLGGSASRRIDARVVALLSQGCAAVVALMLLLLPIGRGTPGAADLWWGAAAGLGSAVGNLLIYRGLADRSATSVAPTSGVVAVTIPVAVGIATGGLPSPTQTVGLILVVPAIWLVAVGGRSGVDRRGMLIGAGAGVGFGTQFTCLAQTSAQAGMAPLAAGQVVSVVLLSLLAAGSATRARLPMRALTTAVIAGVLAGVATVCFQVAAQQGELSIAAAVTSLYPAVTVVVAAAVARRWWTAREGLGLALCAASLVLISV